MDKFNQHKKKQSAMQPPAWADHFLEWYCAPELIEEIQGDLHEAFHVRSQKYGPKRARLLFIIEVIKFFRPSSFQKPFFHLQNMNMTGLLKNYLLLAQRHFFRNKAFTAINVGGLAIGMATFLLLMQYIHFEQSYDQFHEDAEQLYRVTLSSQEGNESIQTRATNYPGVGMALKEAFPEVKGYARLIHHEHVMPPVVLSAERQSGEVVKFREDKMYFADASFLNMFSYPLLVGDAGTALKELNSVVLTSSTAQKYFGEENAIGKHMWFDGDRPLTVTAVLADLPENSHLQFEVLLSYTILQQEDEEKGNELFSAWRWPAFYTYIRLNKEAKPDVLENKFPALVSQYTEGRTSSNLPKIQLALQPVTDIHLKSALLEEASANGSETMVRFLSVIAIAILLIALINYINLSTAKAVERAKEVGLRKSIGASKSSLVGQFLLESALLNLTCLILALGIVALALPYFNQLIGKEVITNYWWQSGYLWKIVGSVFMVSCLLAGLYPAMLLSSFQPKQVLKGKFSASGGGLLFRKALVVFQFAVSVALITGTITIYQQLSFMQEKDLGYEAEQMLIVKAPTLIKDMGTVAKNAEIFKSNMQQQTAVQEITVSNEVPGRRLTYAIPVRKSTAQPEANVSCYWISTDERFLDAFQTKLISGRNFIQSDASPVSPDSENKVLLNEKAVKLLGFAHAEDAVQQEIMLQDKTPAEVIGVIENFHQKSLREDYEPLIFQFPTYYQTLYFALKVNTENLGQTLVTIQSAYEKLFPDNPFEYFFLDDYFNRQYHAEQQFGNIFLLFSCLAIFIACLGLFGLASFTTIQKTKEVGIRKVLGASVSSILTLLSLDFFRLILLSGLLALPLAYIGLEKWLSDYAFHIEIRWWMMFLPLFVVLAVALISVGFQTFKTAISKPVDALRHE